MSKQETTHFGYEQVAVDEKVNKVKAVFSSVAQKYDVMNDLMSFGTHRLWKRFAVMVSQVKKGDIILDLAGGTGDMTARYARSVGPKGRVVLADINQEMLNVGRDRLIDKGLVTGIDYLLANAEALPVTNGSFGCVCIAFGLRNVTDKEKALVEMQRVLKPGGRLIILEFSKPVVPGLKSVYDAYSFSLLPGMGKLIANDSESYRYLAESIRKHPDQESLQMMVTNAGFDHCEVFNLAGGIVALHRAYKY